MTTRVLVAAAGGFIGGHFVKRLKEEGFWVRGVDLKEHEFSSTQADEFVIGDLRDCRVAEKAVMGVDDIYQLAADMGGAGYLFTGEHDAAVMHNSATINLNVLEAARLADVRRVFYSSSACIYPARSCPTRESTHGGRQDVIVPRCGEICWPLEEATFLNLIVAGSHPRRGPAGDTVTDDGPFAARSRPS